MFLIVDHLALPASGKAVPPLLSRSPDKVEAPLRDAQGKQHNFPDFLRNTALIKPKSRQTTRLLVSRHNSFYGERKWSGQQDSNLRPSGPKPDALPGCAIPRRLVWAVYPRLHRSSSSESHALSSCLWTVNFRAVMHFQRHGLRQASFSPIEPATTSSPGLMPSLAAVPALSSRTNFAGAPDGMTFSEYGVVSAAMLTISP